MFTGASGVAHYLAGQFDEAVTWTAKGVMLRPTFVGGQRIHCAALAMAGQLDEAREALAIVRELQPDVSLAILRETVPYATERGMDLFLEGLRKAGLREA